MTHEAPASTHHMPETVIFTQEFWDERYRSADRIWSGRPNPHLVDTVTNLVATDLVVTNLVPATALDVGSGEGADAVWLAARGWTVTGVDVSVVALERAARHAAEAGPEIAERITWQQADAMTWDPAPLRYDLVSAQYVHLPPAELAALHQRLAAAVLPGGTLLIVGHHPSELETTPGRAHLAHLMFTADQIAATISPDDWSITATAPVRQGLDHEGRPMTFRDAVMVAIRRH